MGMATATRAYDETDWTDVNGPAVQPYMKSKTLAERAAWDFVEREGNGMELAVVNPVGIFGPALNGDLSTSIELVKRMLEGKLPGAPRLYLGAVDVRDVAGMQVKAMTDPAAAGQRFLATAGGALSMFEMSGILRAGMGDKAAKAKFRELPDWLVRIVAIFNPLAREAVPRLGIKGEASNAKAREVLGWTVPVERGIDRRVGRKPDRAGDRAMTNDNAPWHAHIYYEPAERDAAEALRGDFAEMMVGDDVPILFVGRMTDRPVGPHPIPQFEIHFAANAGGVDRADDYRIACAR